ncbi:MAG: class I SAM-dependent methyltransferase [Mucilaginibacter sp.]
MAAGYNNAAWFYDSLSRLVYGDALIKAQVYLLQLIPPNANILIVGGGTGWILDEITKLYPLGLEIVYVEIAEKMMALSQKRNTGSNHITYITGAIENVPIPGEFDVIITPFLFDNFLPHTLKEAYNRLHLLLKPNGLWLNTDFQLTGKWWQNVLLKSMFLFFKAISCVEASKLPDIEHEFARHNYRSLIRKTFFGDFILSTAYKKPM